MSESKLAVILVTDTYSTIRPVINRLRKQTVKHQIEIVLAAPANSDADQILKHREEFASIQILTDEATDLAMARAAAIRRATAPFVFVGETHSYPHPGFAEALIAGLSGDWSVVTPAFGNANPNGMLSWAGFLSDYGCWIEGLPTEELRDFPLYNAGFKRAVLLALGDRLAPALAHGDELGITLRSAGHKACLEPAARLDHVNVATLGHWLKERYAAGILIANHRSRQWPLGRRAMYVLGSPLIPLVLSKRVLPGVWHTVRNERLPLATMLWVAIGMMVKAAGELAGYLGASPHRADRLMHEYEVHKLKYAGSSA